MLEAALAGWPKIVYELIQDMAALGSLTRQGHALDITKERDLMYRIFMLKDGCGYITIYPNTVTILENFFTPALVGLPPPPDVRSHVLIAGDSSLALCWFKRGVLVNAAPYIPWILCGLQCKEYQDHDLNSDLEQLLPRSVVF